MSYCGITDAILDDEWFMCKLAVTERYVWMALIAHSSKDRGCLTTDSHPMLAKRICCDIADLDSLVKKAVSVKKMEHVGGGYVFVNYPKYNPDPTNKERQERFRLRHKNDAKQESVTDVTLYNPSFPPLPSPIETQSTESLGNSAILDNLVQNWNDLHKKFPKIPELKGLSKLRKQHALERLSEKAFDWPAIQDKIRGSTFLRGQSEPHNGHNKPFVVTFKYVFESTTNYLNILEGNYDDPSADFDTPLMPPKPLVRPDGFILCPDGKYWSPDNAEGMYPATFAEATDKSRRVEP